MYTDPFDFISTRSNPVPILEDASQSIRLMPYIPADFNLNPSIAQGTTNAKNLSLHALIASDLAKIPNNAPAYDYTTQQEKRYDNPYLQYTPSNILGTDTEDIYGRIQGTPAQFANSIIKTWANFGGTFLSTFLSAPKTFDLSREGKPFEEDDSFATVQNWLTSLEDKLPNYYTEKERNRTDWINALPFSGGAMNFWGDKVIKNIGFSMGALSAGLTIDAAITAALTPTTGGAATPTAVLNGINRIRSLSPKLFTAFRNLAKGAEQTDSIIDAAKLTGNFSKGLELSRLSRIPTAAKYATVSYLTAQGEAFVEGYHTWLDTKKDLLEDAIYRRETDEATMNEIEDRANKAGKWTTALNLPIIMASNLFQFPNLLMGRNVFQKNVNDFVKTQLKTEGIERGVQALSTYSTKRALRKEGWEAIKDIVAEGFEEGAQYHIGSSVHDYYSNRLNPYLKADLLGFVMDNIPETLTDDQFWKEAGIGGLTGFLMGSPASVNRLRKGRERADKTGVRLTNVYDRFNSAVKQYSSTIDLNNSNSNEHIASHDALYSSVHDSVKYGTYDSFIQSLEDLKELDLEEYNKGFQQDFKTPMERDAFVDSMIQDAVGMKADVEKVNSFYKTNPYTTNPMIQRIKKALNPKDQIDLNSIQENLFEDYKEVVARNESLLRKTNGLVLNLKNNLKALGMKDETINYIGNLAQSPKGFKDYLKFKESQIKDLKRQVLYYEELAKSVTDTDTKLDPKFQLRQAKQNLEQTLEYYDRVYEKLGELEKDPKNTEVQNAIRAEVVYEESTEEQRDRYRENEKIRIQKELEEAENLKKTTQAEVENPEKLAGDILKANEKYEEESEPLTETSPITLNVNPLNNFEKGKDIIIDGKRYIVESLDLPNNTATVKDPNTNITFKTDGRTVTSIDVNGTIAQAKLPFEDSQSSLQDKIDDIERRRQEELDNVVGNELTKNALEKANKPSKTKQEAEDQIEKVKKENKDLIDKLENPNTSEEEWDKLAEELQEKFRGTSNGFRFSNGKIEFFYEPVRKGNSININYSNAAPDRVGEYEVGDILSVDNGSTTLPSTVTKVSTTGRILEAEANNGEIIIRNGIVLSANEVRKNREINAKYDAELAALQQPDPAEGYLSSKTEFETYVDTGKVSDATVNRIAQKIKSNQPLTQEEIAMYSDAKDRIESKLQETRDVTRGTREFSIDRIQNYPGTYWIKSESDFSDSSWVYAIKEGKIERHKLVKTQDGVRIGEKDNVFTSKELRSFVHEDNTFVQVLSKGEVEVPIVESITKDVSADIKQFLGKGNTSLYKTIEDQINKGKIKLEC